jgi:putative ABC transport system permease protein
VTNWPLLAVNWLQLATSRAPDKTAHTFNCNLAINTLPVDVAAGRWLRMGDRNAVVLNATARSSLFPKVQLGDSISLLVNGRLLRLELVGIARDIFSPAMAFTTAGAVASLSDANKPVRSVMVGLRVGVSEKRVTDAIEAALSARDMPASSLDSKSSNSSSIRAHTYMLIAILLLIVSAVALIAVAGLASCMSTAVIERTCEFGMRTLGARAYDIQVSVILEAVFIGITSWVMAVALAMPLTIGVGKLLNDTTGRPLPMMFSPTAALLWLLGVGIVATVASVAPARLASQLTVRECLDRT